MMGLYYLKFIKMKVGKFFPFLAFLLSAIIHIGAILDHDGVLGIAAGGSNRLHFFIESGRQFYHLRTGRCGRRRHGPSLI